MHPQITQGIQEYHQTRQADDIDLVQEVRTILINSGLAQNLQAFDSNRFIIEAATKPSSVQRYLLNRFWNQQLITCSAISIEERYCLIPDGAVQDWLMLFKEKVVPFLITNNLPH